MEDCAHFRTPMWSDFVSDCTDMRCMDISESKTFPKYWEGPKLYPSYRNYVYSIRVSFRKCYIHVRGFYFRICSFIVFQHRFYIENVFTIVICWTFL